MASADPLMVQKSPSLTEGPSSPPVADRLHPFHWIVADGVLTVARWNKNHWLLPGYSGCFYPAVLRGWQYRGVAILPKETNNG